MTKTVQMNSKENLYRKASSLWDKNASVRSSKETYEFKSEFNNKSSDNLNWSFKEFTPILSHKNFNDLSEKDQKYIMGMQLLDFVIKTERFEIEYVNKVSADISLGNFEFKFSDEIKLDALKIYTDEGYHAFFSKKISQQIKDYYAIENDDNFDSYVEPFFKKIDNYILSHQENYRHYAKLALVIISENAILSDLSESMKGLVYEPIRNMFKDHLVDETFHAKFYSQVLSIIWDQLNIEQKIIMGECLCDSIELLSKPRLDVFYYSFKKLGFKDTIIKKALSEEYTSDKIKKRTKARLKYFLPLFHSLGALEIKSISNRLFNLNLI